MLSTLDRDEPEGLWNWFGFSWWWCWIDPAVDTLSSSSFFFRVCCWWERSCCCCCRCRCRCRCCCGCCCCFCGVNGTSSPLASAAFMSQQILESQIRRVNRRSRSVPRCDSASTWASDKLWAVIPRWSRRADNASRCLQPVYDADEQAARCRDNMPQALFLSSQLTLLLLVAHGEPKAPSYPPNAPIYTE